MLSLAGLAAACEAAAEYASEDALRQRADSDYVLEYAAQPGALAPRLVAVHLYPRAEAGRAVSLDRAAETAATTGTRDPAERTQAIDVVRRAREEDRVPLLRSALLNEEDVTARVMAARALGRTDSPAATESLTAAATGDRDADVREAAARALGERGGDRAIEPLARALIDDPRAFVRAAAADALGRTGSELAVQALEIALQVDLRRQVRLSAAQALGEVGSPAARAALEAALGDPHPWVREAAREALSGSACSGAPDSC